MESAPNTTLHRMLSRLEHTLLSPASESRLRRSQYERKRVNANIEHARSLLTELEKQNSTIRAQAQRQQAQADAQRYRDVIKRLGSKMQELEQLATQDAGLDDSEDDVEEEDIPAATYAPAQNINAGYDIGEKQESVPSQSPAGNVIRERRSGPSNGEPQSTTTATSSAKQQLFAGRKQHLDFETSETLLSHNNKEQEALTVGLLGLARALKQSSLNFASSLESEKDIMKGAEGGIDKSAQGMDAAERKMGMLRKMSEGQGLYGRLRLYAIIAALWVACFLLVFLGPKLRF